MTQFSSKPVTMAPRGGGASNDVYTVLALIALVVLLAGVIFVWYRSAQLSGNSLPFELPKKVASLTVQADLA